MSFQVRRKFAVMVAILSPSSAQAPVVEQLLDHAFGPNRQNKTSYRYRDGVAPIQSLARVAMSGEAVVGTIQYWPMRLGRESVLLLGPLAVWIGWANQGIGGALMATSMSAAMTEGWQHVFLVGDLAYYTRFGFEPASPWGVTMANEQQHRLLGRCLGDAPLPQPGELQPMRANSAATASAPAPVTTSAFFK
jgi:predicted N-acetyltransferase YhbS